MKASRGHARYAIILGAAAGASLCGCGLAETAASGATGAAAEVKQAQQAPRIEQQVRQQLQAAQDAAATQRDNAEQEAQ